MHFHYPMKMNTFFYPTDNHFEKLVTERNILFQFLWLSFINFQKLSYLNVNQKNIFREDDFLCFLLKENRIENINITNT